MLPDVPADAAVAGDAPESSIPHIANKASDLRVRIKPGNRLKKAAI